MNLNELAREVHANAVAHGWWDGERKAPEIIALIHSEWSEALEEARAGRPHIWYRCGHYPVDKICDYGNGGCEMYGTEDCVRLRGKPEGVAVELIDGCIRILDAFQFFHVHFDESRTLDELMDDAKEAALPHMGDISSLVIYLHYETSFLFMSSIRGLVKGLPPATFLLGALGIACAYVREQGLDPMAILLEKHAYNKTRPYKHGKKF